MMTHVATPVRHVVSWLPLAALVALLLGSALSGHAGIAVRAGAASTVDVTGLVDELVYIDASGCANPAALSIGDLVPNDPWKATTRDCAITFGTSNSSLGADLNVLEDPAAVGAAGDAMRCVEASCNTSSYDGAIDDVAANSAKPAGATSAFGAELRSVAGLAVPSWSTNRVNPVAAASPACRTGDIGDGTCTFGFGASSAADDGPGSYRAQVQFLVLAR